MPPGYQHPEYQAQQLGAAQAGDELSVAKSKPKRMWGRGRKGKDEAEEEQLTEADLYHSPRPAFYAHTLFERFFTFHMALVRQTRPSTPESSHTFIRNNTFSN